MRALLQLRSLTQFQQFLILLAGRVGQVVNYSSLSNDIGVTGPTIKNWLSVLKATYIVFELPPYFKNIRKRIIKSPKLYFTDAGLAAFLLGIHTEEQGHRDPLRGNLYENLIITEIIKGALNKGIRPEIYFFRDSHGHEVDLLIREKGILRPVEIKSAETFSPGFTREIERFRALKPERVSPGTVLYNGEKEYSVRTISVHNPLLAQDVWELLTYNASRWTTSAG